MEIVISIAAEIAKCLVGQCLSQSFLYCNDIQNMKKKVKMLDAARDKVQNSVDAAIRSTEEIEIDVHNWLEKVDVTLKEAKEILEDEEKGNTRSSGGACLKLKQCRQQRKKAKKIVQDIDDALKTGNFDRVSHRPASHAIYVTFESRMSSVKGLMEALRDTNINVIGVWGMPGAGKTTIVNEVVWQAKEEKLFDEVAIAAVMQSPDLRRIQIEIADMLDLKFDVESLVVRANHLRERLKRNKKVLIILDDIWNKLDLEAIGIPCNGCKILLTSRDRDILSCEMNTQKNFELDILSPDEAWSLFEKMAGDSLQDTKLRSFAPQVVEVCAGLPLALVTVATALKNKSLFEWEDALQQLRRPSPVHLTGMQAAMYSKIELSYKHLGSPMVKSFFLLCGQIDSTIYYRDLLKYCFGLCLFPSVCTLEEARNKVSTLVRNLKDSCLLLEDPHMREYVRMHDLVRDVAILIAKAENMFMMRYDDPVKWPDEDALKMCTSISVYARDIHELPDRLVSPKLKLFYVDGRDRDFEISDTCFKGTRELKVLDLTKMRLSSLPSSINLLTNLQTLCLDVCVLKDVAVIGGLKNLEILSLAQSKFTQLPQEIGLLTHLRMLDLSNCTELEVIPPNVLSNLKQLEELYVCDSFTQWELEGVNNERASLAELKHLSLLTTLEVNIPNANMLPKNLLFKKLKRYQIFIGDVWDQFGRSESSRALKLKLNSSFELGRGIKMLLSGIEDLCLDELKGVKSIISELDSKGFQQLKHLHVQNNSEMKYIIHSKGLVIADVLFPLLEIFSLKNMINLEEICHGQIPLTSFGNLSIVKVEHCEKLKFIFSSSIAKSLSQLQTLEIRECSIMGAMVEKEEGRIEDRDMKLFPQLRRLLLHCLPKLMSFLSTQNSDIIDAGEVIPESEQVVFPNLETLELSSIHSEEILLHNQHRASSSFKLTVPRFQNLRNLKVKGSGNLKYLLSSSTATFMVQLKGLIIEDCKVMEEILLLTEDLGEEEIIPKVLFCLLENLVLKDLPVLKRFCIGTNLRFPSLKYLWIEQCPKLESFIFKPVSSGMTLGKELKEVNSEEISHATMQPLFDEKVAFPNLETLIISHMPNLKIIWHDKFAPGSFTKLQSMKVQFCGNLMKIFQVNMLSRFQSLESLVVEDCGSVQEIFELQGQEVTETQAITVTQLKKLFMHRLPKLKHVWNKNPEGTFSFPNLEKISVWECESLKSLFPTSVTRCLKQLEDLRIVECGIEEIIEQEEGAKEDARFVFPKLTLLMLRQLPKLKWFYRGVHTSEWPLLKTLEVSGSNEIQIFASKEFRIEEPDEQSQLETSIQQPLFLVEEVAFPSLETLTIKHMENLKIIWHDQLAEDSFSKLQSLFVEYCENLVNIFESNMLTRFQSLERLEVAYCGSLHEVFQLQRHDVRESHVVTTIPLKRLILRHLPKMKQVWNKDPQGNFSFQNLQEISVWECESLQSLFPASVARCLMQLEDLRIGDCGVEEIVSREEIAEAAARFVFPKVTLLILRKLPKLKWFCRGVHTSEWPLLKKLEVSKCGQIEIVPSKILNFQETVEQSQLETSTQQPLFLVEEVAFPSLETLHLDQCVLEDIAMIGKLRNLENLSLLHSKVEQLPRETGLLTRLRILNLSNCTKLKVIPPNVLSCLIQLEELYFGNSFSQWEVDGLNNERASLAELKHLSRLTTLEVHIPDANMLPKDLLFEKLQRYKIFVGDVWDWSDKHENSRALKLKLNTSFHLEMGIKMLLNGIENLCLDELKGVKSVIYELDMTGFQQLKHLHVQNNVEIKYIINSRGMVISDVVFPVLEILSLKNMINLEEICHGQIPSASFRNLSIMKVEHCEKLKFIFSSTIAKGLPQLQELVIQECSIMGAIIKKEEGEIEDKDMILFPQLRHLELHQLPKLVSFLNTQKSVINDAGEIIPECELDFHMPILQEQVVFPNLETLELSFIHSEEILLHNQHRPGSSFKLTDSRFQNLRNLTVKGSGNLKYLLSSSTATFMVQLKDLYIEDCKVMEEVLHTDEEETLSDALFPRLECLFLEDLPILKRFCIDSNVEFPLLKKFGANSCPKLKTFLFKRASSNMEVRKGLVEINSEDNRHTTSQSHINESAVFANLESLEQSLIDLEEKQQNQHWARSFCKITNMQTSIRFQNLSTLGVWGSDSFKYVLSSSVARSMVQVKCLRIVNCKAMEEILFIEDLGDEEEEEERIPKMLFPRLEFLELNGLPILKRFCVGGNIEFKSMRSLWIEHCPKLKTFISKPSNSDTVMTVCKEIKEMNTEEIPRTVAIQPLFSEEVAFPNLEDLEISYVDDLKIIWDNQIPPYSFCKLREMKVEFCENLMSIFQSDMLTRFRSLENLTITDCGSLQEVFQLQEQDAKETHDVTVIPLKELRLDRVPKLKYVWNKDPQGIFNFPNLNLDSTGLRSYWSDTVPSD